MRFDVAELSLIGHRSDNQDRVRIVSAEQATLLIVVDGMGGHTGGERAAEVAADCLEVAFNNADHPVFDPQGFLTMALARAHDEVVKLGGDQAVDHRPRATCATCLVQDGRAFWAHVGDSRIYQLRLGRVLRRTRDHSHVELLLSEGLITEEEIKDHPMRNFVECCLGGEAVLPDMTISASKGLRTGDVLLLCTDGFWSGLDEANLAKSITPDKKLEDAIKELAEEAVQKNGPHSDNTTVAALRWLS